MTEEAFEKVVLPLWSLMNPQEMQLKIIFRYLEGMFLMGSAVVRSIWKEKSSAVDHHSNTFLVYLYAGP